MMRTKQIALLSVPFGLGAGQSGSELGPDQLLRNGLIRQIEQLGYDPIKATTVESVINIDTTSSVIQSNRMKHLLEVINVSRSLADEVYTAVAEGYFPLIIGGDHSIAIGSLAGLTAFYRNMGIIWFDAHADLNTEASTPSGNMHGISLAVALGQTKLALYEIMPGTMPVKPSRTVIIGGRQLDPAERQLIDIAGIHCFGMEDIKRLGIETIAEEALRIAGEEADSVHLSFDIDSLDPEAAPGTGTKVDGGISAHDARIALEVFNRSGLIASAEFVELNPLLDRDDRTSRLMSELIVTLLA
ncbi:MAG: arginase [Candidatus Pristimantibacillus sp.]